MFSSNSIIRLRVPLLSSAPTMYNNIMGMTDTPYYIIHLNISTSVQYILCPRSHNYPL